MSCICCLSTGGKGVKKAMKKVASGLVHDSERTWFSELSDKGNGATVIWEIQIQLTAASR